MHDSPALAWPRALLGLAALLAFPAAARDGAHRPGVWFRGDFEQGSLEGWHGDLARPGSAVVVTRPVRRGRHAVRIELAPGDRAADKPRAELKLADKTIERRYGAPGGEVWYGWSVLVPAEHADPPGGQFQILAQWHHRPSRPSAPGKSGRVSGPPPLALHLAGGALLLVARERPAAAPRILGRRPIRRGAWTDLVFHVRWSEGLDGFVEAWLDGRPFTEGRAHGRNLYGPVANYLRLGFYRGKGVQATQHVYLDEVRLGGSYFAVAP